ncbi:hypothetical protein [Thiomicrorhabdus heinhorstiae]|uniref:Uncharacterized protein n=1 Tax=Thiomicrorhabdus heinhorstiae TaxID=2748010 RepID=A0ABS0BZ05_9GAMM|nr:hypothetical protein [Thiomicrorhabdus heinhorstiae]MBF6058313.1 hypothetical protein [Thiomicrorhabdus heinhorstiae]
MTKLISYIVLAAFYLFSHVTHAEVVGDFDLKTYPDYQGGVLEFEAFTKKSDGEAFLGIGCSSMSPFPQLQLLLFNEKEIISETPKLLNVTYRTLPASSPRNSSLYPMQGVLQVVDTVDELSNKIRLQVLTNPQRKTMAQMQQNYRAVLEQWSAGKEVEITLSHRTLQSKSYRFSTAGLKQILLRFPELCY